MGGMDDLFVVAGMAAPAAGFPSPHSRSEWRGGVRGGGNQESDISNQKIAVPLITDY